MADGASLFQCGEFLQRDPFDPRPIRGTIHLCSSWSALGCKFTKEPIEDFVHKRASGGCADCPRDLLLRALSRLDIQDTIEQVAEWTCGPALNARRRVAARVQARGQRFRPGNLGLNVAVELGKRVRHSRRPHLEVALEWQIPADRQS